MTYLTSRKFSFTSDALPGDTFGVVRFTGTEGISQCYAFEVMLVSENREIDLRATTGQPATLTVHRDEGDDVHYHGILLRFEQLHEIKTYAVYRAYLVPRLFWLTYTHHNQVFLDTPVPDIISACVCDAGLTPADFELRLQETYAALDYVCQYGESHFDFISRWCEREGIYYFFEQTDKGEKVIFTDSHLAHTPSPLGKVISYSPPSGLDASHEREIVQSFTCTYSLTPASIFLKDYNYMKPSLDITGSAEVDENGRGQAYYYGDHLRTSEEGARLAKIRSESMRCRREVFHAESFVPYVAPGFTFDLEGHYRKGFNQTYLVTQVSHEGNQTGYLVAGLQESDEGNIFYRNTFTAIPAPVQFRAERKTEKPRISGAISAKIDAEGSGQYAQLDEHGRYKVILPFDTSGRKNGKASAWIRMATPYAGADHGMHFPLHKETEVLLTFIDGDPDRPIIAAAVPNPENPSPVASSNQTKSIITTASGNKIHIEDQAGSERILMHTPNQGSFIRIGAHNDPPPEGGENEDWNTYGDTGLAEKTHGLLDVQANLKNEVILVESASLVAGLKNTFTLGMASDIVLGGKWEIHQPQLLSFKNLHTDVTTLNMKAYANRTIAGALKSKVSGLQQRVQASVTAAKGAEIRTAGTNTDALVQNVATKGSDIRTIGQDLENHGNKIHTTGVRMKTIGQELIDAGDSISQAGTKMYNSGVTTQNAGEKMESAGAAIKSGGVAMQEAAQIIQG